MVLYILANTLFAHLHELGAPDAPTSFLRPLLSVVGIFILAKAACGFIAGWGLMQREPWARVIALVLGFISLFNIPFGTAVGVYTLWVLLPAQSQEEYDALVAARAPHKPTDLISRSFSLSESSAAIGCLDCPALLRRRFDKLEPSNQKPT